MNKKTLIISAIAVISLSVLVVLFSVFFDQNRQSRLETADAFVASIANNDPETSFELMSRQLANQVGRADAWRQRVNNIQARDEDAFELEERVAGEDPGGLYGDEESIETFKYSFHMEGGSEYIFSVYVAIDNDGEAKVVDFKSSLR